ncbi:hypothetical protein DL93DRAFT_666040 [Clavulina sp. PMI_390]|nr:hypothetical protein DL93DRAFT_666040 [Clavulina sp. PMI_390]
MDEKTVTTSMAWSAPESTDVPPSYVHATVSRFPQGEASCSTLKPVEQMKPFITPPTNYVSIRNVRDSVKGSWTIDPTLPRPPFLPPSPVVLISSPSMGSTISEANAQQSQGFLAKLLNSNGPGIRDKYPGPEPHLQLYSTYGKVKANVRVVRGSITSLPARLDARSSHGSVKLKIASRGSQRLNIVAVSTFDKVDVALPRDFRGLVRHRTLRGSYKPSSAIAANSNTLSMERGVGISFIASSGSDDWPVDMLTIHSTFGSMKIKYNDE